MEARPSATEEHDVDCPAATTAPSAPLSGCWTDVIPRTAHNRLFLDADYAQTSLGPLESWGTALRSYASMVFADSRAAGVYWGEDNITLYNEHLVPLLGKAHPSMMGRGLFDHFPETIDTLGLMRDKAYATGQTVNLDDILLFLERNGRIEETYFVGQYIPLRGDSGKVEGIYNTSFESTAQRLSERHRRILDLLIAIPPLTTNGTFTAMIEVLSTVPHDIPAALLYAYDETAEKDAPNLTLCGTIGIPRGHTVAPAQAWLKASEGLSPLFRKAKLSGKPLLLSSSDPSSADYFALFEGLEWRGYGEPSTDIAVTPLGLGEDTLGFFVECTNPRRPYDETAEKFSSDLKMQLEAKWLASISKEASERRQSNLEARASASERRLQYLARNAPFGMAQLGPDAKIDWANEQFFEITGLDPAAVDMADFRNMLADDERDASLGLLEEIYMDADKPKAMTREHRLARPFIPPVKEDDDVGHVSAWMLAIGISHVEGGKVKQVSVYLMDISSQKWAESIQERNANAAKLAKRRQEEFIDVTCHEMRNPLSAITQLADGIASNIASVDDWHSVNEDNVAAAMTILTCAAHQKRVIDDVLTLSRLDFQMLSINPVVYSPGRIVDDTVKMFEGETRAKGTEITTFRDPSADPKLLEHAVVDPARLQQILINFLSNAIKFIASEPIRKITIAYGGQLSSTPDVSTTVGDIVWIAPEATKIDALPKLARDEQPLFLHFIVQDTGPGIAADQMKKLFRRFSQASSRSHISYGGSGLGLYISRQLVEMQGGKVGAASIDGTGSAFAFYVEARTADATPDSLRPRRRSLGHGPQDPKLAVSVADAALNQLTAVTEATVPLRKGRPSVLPPRDVQPAPMSDLSNVEGVHILLVEDNLINQKVLSKQLRRQHCVVTVASDGAEALQVLENTGRFRDGSQLICDGEDASPSTDEISVVLMDIEMPIMDGLECTKRIRELEANRHSPARRLPIIAVTANARREHRDTAEAAGMDDFISKPITAREVVKKVSEVLRRMSLASKHSPLPAVSAG